MGVWYEAEQNLRKVKKALNLYLFHVEYGYAPKEKINCKKAGMLGKKDKYWEDNIEDVAIRVQDNLLPINKRNTGKNMLEPKGMYSDSEDKKSLRMKLKAAIEEWLTLFKKGYNAPYKYPRAVRDLFESIEYNDKYLEKYVKIPYYCTNTNKKNETFYSKIGEWPVIGFEELLYVTEFEEKLYHVQLMMTDMNEALTEDNDGTSFYNLAEPKKEWNFLIKGNQIQIRTKFIDVEQRKERRKGIDDIAAKAPFMDRWKLENREYIVHAAGEVLRKIDNVEVDKYRDKLLNDFNEKAKQAGWDPKRNDSNQLWRISSWIRDNFYKYFWDLDEGDKTATELQNMKDFFIGTSKYNMNTATMDIDIKDLMENYVEGYTFNKTVKNVNISWILTHQSWLEKRSEKFVSYDYNADKKVIPMTVVQNEFFGGTLRKGKSCSWCMRVVIDQWGNRNYTEKKTKEGAHYGTEYSFNENLDINTYTYGGYFVLKNLIPEDQWKTAIVQKITERDIGPKKTRDQTRGEFVRGAKNDTWSVPRAPRGPRPEKSSIQPKLKF
tara:strand:- start:1857 stop:3503 length:1647 start_codon:yes stop_codon:yes gene_type:complete